MRDIYFYSIHHHLAVDENINFSHYVGKLIDAIYY